MMTIDYSKTPIRNPGEGIWELYSAGGKYIKTFKTRKGAVNHAHDLEIKKINRIKALEQFYSRYKGLSLWSAK